MLKNKHPVLTIEDIKKVEGVLKNGTLSDFRGSPEGHLGGKWVRALEDAFCDYFNIKYAVAMNSATACLHAACIACNVGEGNQVIVSPYTFVSSASCVKMVGAKPVFIDIRDDIFCIDNAWITKAIQPNTKAIIPVHLCGHSADMEIYTGLNIIEDCAQAIGAKYRGKLVGTIGDCGVFSFNQSKTISTGEGGILITNDGWIARICRAIRNHGEVSDPELGIIGYNYRMCEVEAVLALQQFKHLDEMNDWRIELADYMTRELLQIDGLTPPFVYPDCKHVYYTYAIKFDADKMGMTRDEFQDELLYKGIYFGKGYVQRLYISLAEINTVVSPTSF